jgi:hypothetical protein
LEREWTALKVVSGAISDLAVTASISSAAEKIRPKVR